MVHYKYVCLNSSALNCLLREFEAPVLYKINLFLEPFGQFIERGCRTDVEAAISGEIGVFKRWDCPNIRTYLYSFGWRVHFQYKFGPKLSPSCN